MTSTRDYFHALAASAMDLEAPAPAPEPRRARELSPVTVKRARARRARDARARRADALERLEARASRAASAAGEPYRPIPRIPARVWALASAVVRDTSGRTASTALSTLPLELRHRAQRELAGTARELATRYRVALLVALSALARPHRSRRRPGRVVSGFARGAVAALVRSPATGEALSVSRVFGRRFNAHEPLLPWLHDRGLLRREQPGLGARGVVRGPSGYALGLYYLDGPALELEAPAPSSRRRSSSGFLRLEELLERPPD